MIIKASTRGNSAALARHLLNDRDNDQVEVHEVRGFIADDVFGAMRETEAVSKGIKSRQPLFSVSLSPPERESVGNDVFDRAIAAIEEANGLRDQPRIVLFHEKEGRRHAHAVWSRIDLDHMRAIPLPFYKQKLNEIAKGIYLEQGWELPPGFIDKRDRSPLNYDLAQYQQAKREGLDAKTLKLLAQEAWAISDSREAFEKALEQRGLYLARGDRRSHVAMTWQGEVRSLPKLLDRKTKEVRERLGAADAMRSVEDTKAHIAATVAPTLQRVIGEADAKKAHEMKPLDAERAAMKNAHRIERERMDAGIAARREAETPERAGHFRTGLAGLLDKVTGRAAQMRQQNEREAWAAHVRDRAQRQAMIEAQLAERQALQQRIRELRDRHEQRIAELHRDLALQIEADRSPEKSARLAWLEARQRSQQAEQPAHQQQPAIDRLEWLQSQQRKISPPEPARDVQRDEALTPKFNDRLQWLEQRQLRPSPSRDADNGPDRGPAPER